MGKVLSTMGPHIGVLLMKGFLCKVLCCVQWLSHVQLFETPWTVACWAPLSMGFSRQEYWSGLLFPPPECVVVVNFLFCIEV